MSGTSSRTTSAIELTLRYEPPARIAGLRIGRGPNARIGGGVFVMPAGSDQAADASSRPRAEFDGDGRMYFVEFQIPDAQLPTEIMERFRTDGGWTPDPRHPSVREIMVPLRYDSATGTADVEMIPPTHGRRLTDVAVTPFGFAPGTKPNARMRFDAEARLHGIVFPEADGQLPVDALDRLRAEDV